MAVGMGGDGGGGNSGRQGQRQLDGGGGWGWRRLVWARAMRQSSSSALMVFARGNAGSNMITGPRSHRRQPPSQHRHLVLGLRCKDALLDIRRVHVRERDLIGAPHRFLIKELLTGLSCRTKTTCKAARERGKVIRYRQLRVKDVWFLGLEGIRTQPIVQGVYFRLFPCEFNLTNSLHNMINDIMISIAS